MTNHKEVAVKVNVFVDEGIAELVAALSEFEGLATLESCQGEPGEADAFVLFRHGDWRQSGAMLFEDLMPALSEELRGQVSLRLESFENGAALGSILIDPDVVDELTKVVRSLGVKGSATAVETKPAAALPGLAANKPALPNGISDAASTKPKTPVAQQSSASTDSVSGAANRGLPSERAVAN